MACKINGSLWINGCVNRDFTIHNPIASRFHCKTIVLKKVFNKKLYNIKSTCGLGPLAGSSAVEFHMDMEQTEGPRLISDSDIEAVIKDVAEFRPGIVSMAFYFNGIGQFLDFGQLRSVRRLPLISLGRAVIHDTPSGSIRSWISDHISE